MFADQENNTNEEQDVVATLGTIFGVSELRQKASQQMIGAPVLVAEQALVFFAWQEGEV